MPIADLLVVGAGRMGRHHALNLAAGVRSARLAGVVDPETKVAGEVAAECRVACYGSLDEALDSAHVDGVVIAAPPAAHVELALAAIGRGKPVLCEKPLGLAPTEAERAVTAAEKAGVELRVAFQRRFHPGWIALRDAASEGRLGTVGLFRSTHRNARLPRHAAQLGDVLIDLAVHDLDAARWLAGPIESVFARTDENRRSATISLRFRSGALGLIDVDRAVGYGFESSAELVGSRATVRLGDAADGLALLAEGRSSRPLARDHVERHALAYANELDAFGRLAAGEADGAGASGRDAVATLRLAGLAQRSAETGQAQGLTEPR